MQISSLPRLFDISGGLIWHARALRFRNQLWRPFRENIRQYLQAAPKHNSNSHRNFDQKPHQTLLLIGPSAGWCLTDDFLTVYPQIICIDPDPLAPLLFDWVHGKALRKANVSLSWREEDFFADPQRHLEGLADPIILFCNVAGQLFLQDRPSNHVEEVLVHMKHVLSGMDWGSFHDLFSAPISQDLPMRLYPSKPEGQKLLTDYGLSGAWLDHLTGELLPKGNERLIIPWQLKPDRLHLVEAGWVRAQK
jgi:hypothetical protein